MSFGRMYPAATVLNTGQVLVSGGGANGDCAALMGGELYSPSTDIFSSVGSMSSPRQSQTSTLLANGKVLVAGGWYGYCSTNWTGAEDTFTADIYDPATGNFSPTGRMTISRSGHTATLLKNGLVLIAGGVDNGVHVLSSAE